MATVKQIKCCSKVTRKFFSFLLPQKLYNTHLSGVGCVSICTSCFSNSHLEMSEDVHTCPDMLMLLIQALQSLPSPNHSQVHLSNPHHMITAKIRHKEPLKRKPKLTWYSQTHIVFSCCRRGVTKSMRVGRALLASGWALHGLA